MKKTTLQSVAKSTNIMSIAYYSLSLSLRSFFAYLTTNAIIRSSSTIKAIKENPLTKKTITITAVIAVKNNNINKTKPIANN